METDNLKPIRKIVHVGVDFFYAAVMMRNEPSLQGKPVVAVYDESSKREMICSASYEARKFGIHAGMKTYEAKELCPKVVILVSEIDASRKESKKIRAIFHRFTDVVEPLSLDEAYLDVTASDQLKGDSTLIASEIRKLIHQEFNLAASAGIAPNKFLAKVATDWKKPNGQFTITPDMVNDFVQKLSVKKIWDIGRETGEKMADLGLITCGDLQKLSFNDLNTSFGNIGKYLYHICRGIDDRPVVASKEPKLLSIEEMFPSDIQIVYESKENEKPADKRHDLGKIPISKVMNPSVITISETLNTRMAIKIMLNQKISGLPVVNGAGHLTGVISERDLLISSASESLDSPIKYTKSPEYLTANLTLKDALMKLLKQNRKWLPVIDSNKKPIGIIARRDLLQIFSSQDPKLNL
tara:strand:- start:684 stop:1916 length:1233 start_codon:yes stop_codon:yes gene_type:complete